MALFGSLAAPLEGFLAVAGHAPAIAAILGDFGLRRRHAVKRRPQKPFMRLVGRFHTMLAGFVDQTQAIFAGGISLFGSKTNIMKPRFLKFRRQPDAGVEDWFRTTTLNHVHIVLNDSAFGRFIA